MKALVYTAPNEVTLRDEPEPRPGPGEVLVRVDAVGICGSDMHAYHGHDPRRVPPLVLGHEAAGEVCGGPRAGQRVAVNPLITCGQCADCLDGRSNLCARRQLIGMTGRAGAFTEWLAIPERNLIPIPEGMTMAHAALMEPAGTSLHAVHLAARAAHRPLNEARALVVGAGAIGVLAALFLRSHGCRSVTISDTNALRRRTAERAGDFTVIDPLAGTGPADAAFDVVIDAVGSAATRRAAVAAIRPGGVIVHVGLQDNDGGLDIRRITLQEVTLIGTYTYRPVDLAAALTALHEGALGSLEWFEERPLDDGARAFQALDQGRTAAAKIILRPGGG